MRFAFGFILAFAIHGNFSPTALADTQTVSQLLKVSNGSNVQNIFSERPDIGDKPSLKFFPEPRTIYDLEEEQEEQAQELKKEAEQKEEPKKLAAERKPLSSREEVIEALGNPDEDVPVLAQPDAPKPFQGILQAQAIGDKQLAFKFARQYVRYINAMRKGVGDAVGLIAKASEREGFEDGEGWTAHKDFDKFNKLLEEDIEAQRLQEEQDTLLANASPETRALIENAEIYEKERARQKEIRQRPRSAKERKDKFMSEPESPARILETEAGARAKIRQQLAGRVPLAVDGKVKVTLFFRPKDRNSILLGAEIQKLAQAFKKDSRIEFEAYSINGMNQPEEMYYRKKTGLNFLVHTAGLEFLELPMRRAPTVEFTAVRTGKSIREEGVRGFIYFHEIIKSMQGEF